VSRLKADVEEREQEAAAREEFVKAHQCSISYLGQEVQQLRLEVEDLQRELELSQQKLEAKAAEVPPASTQVPYGLAPVWDTAADRDDRLWRLCNAVGRMKSDASLGRYVPGTPGVLLLDAYVQGFNLAGLKAIWMTLSRICHKDKGGSDVQQAGINLVWEALQQGALEFSPGSN
jgi:hypothetical protein